LDDIADFTFPSGASPSKSAPSCFFFLCALPLTFLPPYVVLRSGVRVEKLEHTASASHLNSLLFGHQQFQRSSNCFVFAMKQRDTVSASGRSSSQPQHRQRNASSLSIDTSVNTQGGIAESASFGTDHLYGVCVVHQ
jgi:hypothetical protein